MTDRTGSARVLSVNVGVLRPNPAKDGLATGIDKQPVAEEVHVRAPGDMLHGLGSGLVGDVIGDKAHHGGDDQAVYAYAREDLEHFERLLGRPLAPGTFGENLTTDGLDVSGARIGERWAIGNALVLQVTDPRIPCATFCSRMDVSGWLKTFAVEARPGAYLRVVEPGPVRVGDEVRVIHRPDVDVTIRAVFRQTYPG